MEEELSVIIISYNMGELIGRALKSLSLQTKKNFEVIVVDNHSSDNTKEIVSGFSNLDIKFLEIYNDGILSKSRNLGIENSSGDWIAFLDADDYWESNKVEKLSDIINKIEKNVVAISHKCYEEDTITGTRKVIKYTAPDNDLYKYLIINKNPFSLSGMTVKKSVLVDSGLFSESPDIKTVEDFELWIRLSKYGDFYCSSDVLSTIVLHENNYSKKVELQMKALHTMKSFYIDNENELTIKEKKRAYTHLYELEMRCLQKNASFDEAKRIYLELKGKGIFSIKILIIWILVKMKINK